MFGFVERGTHRVHKAARERAVPVSERYEAIKRTSIPLIAVYQGKGIVRFGFRCKEFMGTRDAFDPFFPVFNFDFAGELIHPRRGLAGLSIVRPAVHPYGIRRNNHEQRFFHLPKRQMCRF